MVRAALLAATVGLAGCAPAAVDDRNRTLAANAQRTLTSLGYAEVDASSLTTRQLAAIHLNVAPRAPGFGRQWINLRQEVKVILGWDGYELRR